MFQVLVGVLKTGKQCWFDADETIKLIIYENLRLENDKKKNIYI